MQKLLKISGWYFTYQFHKHLSQCYLHLWCLLGLKRDTPNAQSPLLMCHWVGRPVIAWEWRTGKFALHFCISCWFQSLNFVWFCKLYPPLWWYEILLCAFRFFDELFCRSEHWSKSKQWMGLKWPKLNSIPCGKSGVMKYYYTMRLFFRGFLHGEYISEYIPDDSSNFS